MNPAAIEQSEEKNRENCMGETSDRKKGWLRKKAENGRRLLTNRIDSRKLQPGDHIYGYRQVFTYSHHGIYVGSGRVIHFIPTLSRPNKGKSSCQECGHRDGVHTGVVKTCLDFFLLVRSPLADHSIYLYQYGVSRSSYNLKRAGSCSRFASKTPDEVVSTAERLLKNGFGQYNLIYNNCENFATYCKTDRNKSVQVEPVPLAGIALTLGATLMKYGGKKIGYKPEDESEGEGRRRIEDDSGEDANIWFEAESEFDSGEKGSH